MRLLTGPVVALAALLCVPLPSVVAQGDGGRDKETVREQLEKEISRKRDAMRDGKVIRSSVRVRVRLRNKSKIAGVVKNGRFIEKVDGLAFVPADLQTPGAGLRIWYYDNTNSFIFLPYRDIAHYRIGERLTDEEIAQIEERIRRAQREANERRRELLAKRDSAKTGKDSDGDGKDDADTGPELTPEQKELLTEFPPADGWGTERMREIEIKKITVGVFPDAKSKRFVNNFEEWLKAKEVVEAYERAAKKAEAEKKAKKPTQGDEPAKTDEPAGDNKSPISTGGSSSR